MDPIVIEAVLHPTDIADPDFGTIAHALRIALAAHGRLTYLHVGAKGEEVDWEGFPQTRKVLAAWGVIPENASHDDVRNIGLAVRKSVRKGDDILAEIGGEIRKGGADLIVLATHQRRRLWHWLRKPLAESIVHEIRRPTLLIPRDSAGFVDQETGQVTLRNVLVPVCDYPDPMLAIAAVVGLVLLFTPAPTHFRFLHVGHEENQPELEDPKHAGWTVEHVAREGPVVRTILEEAETMNADLIAMATAGREGFLDALRGTTTEQVLRRTACPLLAVPA